MKKGSEITGLNNEMNSDNEKGLEIMSPTMKRA